MRNEAIVFTELDDAIVMMDVEEGSYYELDPVGTRIWVLLERGPRVAELCETLQREYDVDARTCRDDVRAFLEEMSGLGIVRMRQTEAPAPPADSTCLAKPPPSG